MNYNDYLYLEHHGVKGMHWGVRKDRGSGSARKEAKAVKKAVKNDRNSAVKNRRILSDADIDQRINRLKKERQLKELTEEDLRPGRTTAKRILASSGKKVVGIAAVGTMAYAGKVILDRAGYGEAAKYIFPNPNKKK